MLVWGLFASCETKVPAGIISSSDMVDVLYDYHLAQAMAAQASDSSAYRYRVYTQAVLQKYGLTQAEFDSSMVWYTRHADYLYDVYKQVDQRFSYVAFFRRGYGECLVWSYVCLADFAR